MSIELANELSKLRNILALHHAKDNLDKAYASLLAAKQDEVQSRSALFLDAIELAAFYINSGLIDGEAAKFLMPYIQDECSYLAHGNGPLSEIFRNALKSTGDAYAEMRRIFEATSSVAA